VRQYYNGRLRDAPCASIWRKPEERRRRIVDGVSKRLLESFGKPRLGNPKDPVDDLVFLMLSNRTQSRTAKRVFNSLKETGTWDVVTRLSPKALEDKIQIAGLAKKRSQQIKMALRRIHVDFGACKLDRLRHWPEAAAQEYLTALPGVSEKVAKCVMMYTLGFDVLPVDAHVFRVSSRLGWTSRCRADQCHADLESLVPRPNRWAFHVNCIVLGRTICTSRIPNCFVCPIKTFCCYYLQRDEPMHAT
jgi:endonuclease III